MLVTVDLDQCRAALRLVRRQFHNSTPYPESPGMEVAMSDSLEHALDLTLNMRARHRRQHEAELALKKKAIRSGCTELEQRQARFCNEVRPLIQSAVERANQHFATRPEGCEFCEVSEYSVGPWYPGASICAPLVYKLRVEGRDVSEALVVELTHNGMVEAVLGPLCPSDRHSRAVRAGFGWHPNPLFSFDIRKASNLLVQYLEAITERWPASNGNAKA
jgi:hypothetical protein